MNFLILTAHDYRTPRRANMHFIADELAKKGPTRFFSLRYSGLSKRKNDARAFLDDRANRIERHRDVDCYLWKEAIHPFNTRVAALRPVEDALFRWSQAHPPTVLVEWMREADVIFFESGSAIVYVDLAARVNPAARRVYIASDDLDVIQVADFVKRTFARVASGMSALCLPSPLLADRMPSTANRRYVPHGLDASIADRADPNPFARPGNAVSVGSMLFDRTFFEIAAPAFPDLTFHVIGSGLVQDDGFPANVRIYDEMSHDETLRHIKHADVGIAPYGGSHIPVYLTDTSMKLMQYAFFGIPSVCPFSAAGTKPWRFGYEPGLPRSIVDAMARALRSSRCPPPPTLGWDEVTARLIDPASFTDTRMPDVLHV